MDGVDVGRWRERSPPLPALLVGVAAIAVLARLVLLGDRIAHWDEGRVGYDVLRFMATGMWEYRPIVHGPFLPHVNRVVFGALGASDFTSRLVVAVIGGLLPLGAWLYRDHLRDGEVLALAVLLAADPILLYYSRFMRNDIPVAAFAFVAVGCLLRLRTTGRHRYLYAGVGAFGLALTAKENAVLYVLAVGAAVLLLLDHRLFLAREGEPRWTAVAADRLSRTGRAVWRLRLPIVVAAVELLAIVVFFYAPRGGADGGLGLWLVLDDPSIAPAVLEAATVGAAEKLVDQWIGGTLSDHGYLPFLGSYLEKLAFASGPLALLAVLGFVTDRYRGERPRDVVALGFYWGLLSVAGYPIAMDIKSAWAVVHAVVPLAIPAAAGVMLFVDWGREAAEADDGLSVGLVAVVLLLLSAGTAWTAVETSYLEPQRQDNVLVQYAQPEGRMRPALEAIDRAAADTDGLDVLWYGGHFYLADESTADRPPVPGSGWYNRLPLPWYLEAAGASVGSVNDTGEFGRVLAAESPPVVITRTEEAGEIEDDLAGYHRFEYEARQFSLTYVFFIRPEYVDDAPART